MSKHWVEDILFMQDKYGVQAKMDEFKDNQEVLNELLKFKSSFLKEELTELNHAIYTKDPDLVVDSIIDLIVVAMDTLAAFRVDLYTAWDRVLEANLNKTPGMKPNRPNKFGFPDLIKADDWKAPEHHDNLGLIEQATK